MASVVIDIATEFTGKKGFKQAETSTDKLSKSVKSLGKNLGLALSATAVIAFGKASIKAFMEDEAAAARLTKAVQNLGLGFEDARIKTFIQDLESTALVADDVLRPAFQSLLTTTGSVAKSQDLLKLALDVSAGSGESLATVSNDLALAYVGQTKGLKKYDLGLTAAELSTANFEDIQKKLNGQFSGQNATRLDTYAGKMEAVNIAFGNAQETIGAGLLDAFSILGGDAGIGSVTNAINEMATAASESIVSLALVVEELQKIPVVGGLLDRLKNPLGLPQEFLAFGKGGLLDEFRALSKESKQFGGIYATKYLGELDKANAAARKKAEQEAAKRAKLLLDNKNKQLAVEKAQLAAKKLQATIDKANLLLGKGESVFDLDKIQLNAALINQAQLLGKATEGSQILQIANDTARLNVKRSMLALEEAIASKDEAAILAATAKLNEDLKILGALSNQKTQMVAIESILKGLSPKDLINQENLNEALRKIRLMLDLLAQVKPPSLIPSTGTPPPSGGPFVQTPNGISPITPARSVEEINKAVEELGGVISVIGENGKEFIKLIDGLAPTFQTIEDSGAFNALVNSFANGAMNPFNAGSFRTAEGGSLFNSGAVGSRDRDINITIQANTIANPDELTNLIQDSIIRLNRRGDSLTQAGAL
jgi:hypothetical protein